ncbi:hypothetical protein PR048_009767 [Dryococelus australis]|uniref:Uncharacterized protein n=1 Tax=Dryococelus australis TaxID=614101 RepID=A0ABQ9I1T3_9NEOP|nr:hypothetical protein PR048_009767 [Dryococelus australis]
MNVAASKVIHHATGLEPICHNMLQKFKVCNEVVEPGAAVAERLARPPPTKANRAQYPAGSPNFRKWESCRMMPLVSASSRISSVSHAPSFRR